MKARGLLKDIKYSYKSEHPEVTFVVRADAETMEKYIDKDLDIEIKIHREHRSNDANAMFWACIGELAAAHHTDNWSVYLLMIERYGVFVPLATVPEAVPKMKAMWRVVKVIGERNGMVEMLCFYGSSTYDSKEFSRLLEGVISEMKECGLDLPPSGDIKRAIEAYEKEHHNGP